MRTLGFLYQSRPCGQRKLLCLCRPGGLAGRNNGPKTQHSPYQWRQVLPPRRGDPGPPSPRRTLRPAVPRGPWGERLARAVAAVSTATWPGDAAAGETGRTSSSFRNDVPPHRRAAEALSQVMAVGAGAQKAQNSSEVSSPLALFFFKCQKMC